MISPVITSGPCLQEEEAAAPFLFGMGVESVKYPVLPEGCYSRPPLCELHRLSAEEQSAVIRLVVGKPGFGEVEFEDVTDVSRLDLRDALSWEGESGACCAVNLVAPDKMAHEGKGAAALRALDRRATVTLFCGDGFDAETIEGDFRESDGDVDFLAYDTTRGELRFSVSRLCAD